MFALSWNHRRFRCDGEQILTIQINSRQKTTEGKHCRLVDTHARAHAHTQHAFWIFNVWNCSHLLSSCTYRIALTLQSLFTTFITTLSLNLVLLTPRQQWRSKLWTTEAENTHTHTIKFVFFTYSHWGKIERLRYWPVEFSYRTQTRMNNVKVATVFMFLGIDWNLLTCSSVSGLSAELLLYTQCSVVLGKSPSLYMLLLKVLRRKLCGRLR